MFRHEYDVLSTNNRRPDLAYYGDVYIPDLNKRYYFNDPDINVHGYILWKSKEINFLRKTPSLFETHAIS